METNQPWRLAADNFTPATRTPWGGRYILDVIKSERPLAPAQAAYPVVGESWEVSVEPSFPSRIVTPSGPVALHEAIDADPVAALGEEVWRKRGGYPLLVKLLDAAKPLSVQVHPADDYARLGDDESGKPESWYIVHARPGSGLYLGLRDGVDEAAVAAVLRNEGDLSTLLNFVEVAPGDCFEIDAGTIHAIGPGVTLVEPQQVLPGKKGVTYRYWDWNRRYDAQGVEDPDGAPRALHVENSLAVTDFAGPRGAELVESVRRTPQPISSSSSDASPALQHERFIDGPAFRVDAIRGTGTLELPLSTLTAVVVLDGMVRCAGQRFERGESFVLPAAMGRAPLELSGAWAVVSAPS